MNKLIKRKNGYLMPLSSVLFTCNMRKTMLFIALCVASVANAQSFRIGPMAGVEHNNPSDMESKTGFNVGVHSEMFFKDSAKDGLFLDASLLFNAKNFKTSWFYNNDTKKSLKWDYNTYGITAPLNIGYKFTVSKSVNLFAATGPYMNIGLGGKSKKATTTVGSKEVKSTVSNNVYSDNLMNRVNWGFDFKVGAELYRHYQVNIGYELGMNKIFKNSLESKHRTLSFGVAYMF